MIERPHKPPEFGGGPSKPKRGRPRKAPRNIEKPVKPREPWLSSKPKPEPSIYPVWTQKNKDTWSIPQKEYWDTLEYLIALSKSQVNLHEAETARAKMDLWLVNRPDEYAVFPPHILEHYPELTEHPTRLTLAELRNKIKIRNKKDRTYLKELPKNEDSENYRLRVTLLYHTWLAGQVNGWLNARQLMHYMDIDNYNTFRGLLQYIFAYGYGYETKQVRVKGKKSTLYRLKTVPAHRWLEHDLAPTSVCAEQAIPDSYPQNYERPVKFILETDLEGKPLKPLYMVDLQQVPDSPALLLETTRVITEGVNLWDSGYPGKRKGT